VTTAPPIASGPTGPSGPTGDRGPGSPLPPPPSSAPIRSGHRVRYAVVGLVLVGSLAFLLFKGLGSALNFYLPANQAVAQRATLGSQTFNLEGVVEPGSIHSTSGGVDFVVTSGTTSVHVENSSSPPQLFQPDIPVIAVGHFSGTSFVSDQILVKHSSDYIAAYPGRVTAPNGTKR
jgi:cytochrome c-type biogenesis protein CcmE